MNGHTVRFGESVMRQHGTCDAKPGFSPCANFSDSSVPMVSIQALGCGWTLLLRFYLRVFESTRKKNRQKVSTKSISWYFHSFPSFSICMSIHFPKTMPPPCPDRFIVQPRWLHRERHGVPRAHRISTGGGSKTWMVMVLI